MIKAFIIGTITGMFASCFYQFCINVASNRRIIDYNLEIILDLVTQFESCIKFNCYELAMTQIDRIIDKLGVIYENINSYTYFPKMNDKKLILTILYNLQCFCQIMKNVAFGETSAEEEKISRCERIKKIYLLYSNENSDSCLCISLKLIKDINLGNSAKEFLKENSYNQELSEKLVNHNIFGYSKLSKFETKYDIFTDEEYENYIKQNLK